MIYFGTQLGYFVLDELLVRKVSHFLAVNFLYK